MKDVIKLGIPSATCRGSLVRLGWKIRRFATAEQVTTRIPTSEKAARPHELFGRSADSEEAHQEPQERHNQPPGIAVL